MRGVINVRGSVVPVADMRLKFGIPVVDNTMDTRIVVMKVTIDGETVISGARADAVKEVIASSPAMSWSLFKALEKKTVHRLREYRWPLKPWRCSSKPNYRTCRCKVKMH